MPEHYTLNDGTTLPTIGLGTYSLWGYAGAEAMSAALQEGYRLLDSAVNYENEGAVGRAVKMSGIAREDIRVASKLPGRHHKKSSVVRTIEESLLRTGLDYLDLYLIHWPNPSQGLYLEAWEGMIDARERGLVRSIGVSNFLPEYLDVLIERPVWRQASTRWNYIRTSTRKSNERPTGSAEFSLRRGHQSARGQRCLRSRPFWP